MVSNSDASSGSVLDRGPAVFIVTTTTLALASIFVVARLVSRFGIVRHVGLDDYTMILAWLLAFGLSLTVDLATTVGLGKHESESPEQDIVSLRRREYVFSVLYVWSPYFKPSALYPPSKTK